MDLRNQRVGVCQFRPLLGDIEKNLSKHLEWVERGREGGADFLVFPELSGTWRERWPSRRIPLSGSLFRKPPGR